MLQRIWTLARLFVVLVLIQMAGRVLAQKVSQQSFQSNGRTVGYELFASGTSDAPVVILLSGTSGPEMPFYRGEAVFYARHGYDVLLLHYYDATKSTSAGDATYTAWAGAVADLVQHCRGAEVKARPIFVLGYSLGGSIALAAGSQALPVQGVAEWYGSLPDHFFFTLKSMPPLLILHGSRDRNIPVVNAEQLVRLCEMRQFDCTSHIYPAEDHGFSAEALRDAQERTLAFFRAHAGAAVPDATGAPEGANP